MSKARAQSDNRRGVRSRHTGGKKIGNNKKKTAGRIHMIKNRAVSPVRCRENHYIWG